VTTNRSMTSLWVALWGCAAAALFSPAAYAWNDTGHKVVARIAWDHLKPTTREAAIALLKAGPDESDLPDLFPNDSRPLPFRQREFFLLASTWPDIVRDSQFPERRKKFHRRDWHFINFFFEQQGRKAVDRPDLKPAAENVVERLQSFQSSTADASRPESQRAIELAWILHLVGDIHQPLHCSARVTPSEPQGDQGGNLFLLNGGRTLHGFWDDILSTTLPKQNGETEDAYINRIAAIIIQRHPRATMEDRLLPGQFEEWARAGFATAKEVVYPRSLKRGQAPSQQYRKKAFETAEPAIALAGYRLAAMLDGLFAP
jgi:hypothetical protein